MRRATRRKNPYPSLVKEYRRLFVKAATDAFDDASEGAYWGEIFDQNVVSDLDVIELARDLVATSISGRDERYRRRMAEMAYELLSARSVGE